MQLITRTWSIHVKGKTLYLKQIGILQWKIAYRFYNFPSQSNLWTCLGNDNFGWEQESSTCWSIEPSWWQCCGTGDTFDMFQEGKNIIELHMLWYCQGICVFDQLQPFISEVFILKLSTKRSSV